MSGASPHGVLLCDKPPGPSSHAVVACTRRALGTRRVGHAGTLDPLASGVLVLAVGEACKVLRYLVQDDKRYQAAIRLGVETDSLDADGRVVQEQPVPELTLERVRAVASGFVGAIVQRAPAISAIKQGGVALHARVRRGEAVEPPERRVEVYALEVNAVRGSEIELEVHCGKGFYVRALARDLARALGTVGHLTALRRVQSGPFAVEQAVPFSTLSAAAAGDAGARDALLRALLPIRAALASAPALALDDEGVAHAEHGRPIALAHVVSGALPEDGAEPVLLGTREGALLAIGRREGAVLRVVRGLSLRG